MTAAPPWLHPTASTSVLCGMGPVAEEFCVGGKLEKRFNKAVAFCVTFSHQIVSIFNSEAARISIVSLFITLCFVFCALLLLSSVLILHDELFCLKSKSK